MFEKKEFNVALFHMGKFEFCPTDKTHSHSVKLIVTARSGLGKFVLDSIIPSEVSNLEAFFELFNQECEAANVDLVSLEIYFTDIDMSYVNLY